MGKSTISMVIFYSYVKLPEGNVIDLLGLIVSWCLMLTLQTERTQPDSFIQFLHFTSSGTVFVLHILTYFDMCFIVFLCFHPFHPTWHQDMRQLQRGLLSDGDPRRQTLRDGLLRGADQTLWVSVETVQLQVQGYQQSLEMDGGGSKPGWFRWKSWKNLESSLW